MLPLHEYSNSVLRIIDCCLYSLEMSIRMWNSKQFYCHQISSRELDFYGRLTQLKFKLSLFLTQTKHHRKTAERLLIKQFTINRIGTEMKIIITFLQLNSLAHNLLSWRKKSEMIHNKKPNFDYFGIYLIS